MEHPYFTLHERFAYEAGRYTSKVVFTVLGYKTVRSSLRFVRKVAINHSIDTLDAAVVTQNVFDCLKYID
jgi:hypothetical protein